MAADVCRALEVISIHAPRTGSDAVRGRCVAHRRAISIHAPRTGSDVGKDRRLRGVPYFNPRSPHGERLFIGFRAQDDIRISIHAPRTGSDGEYYNIFWKYNISIHAPRTGSDNYWYDKLRKINLFQSTLPARGATRCLSR